MAKKRKRTPKSILKLPDLEQSKSAVVNSLPSVSSQRSYNHAIRQFIDWYCSEPRLAFNRIVVTRHRIFLEQAHYASSPKVIWGTVKQASARCGLAYVAPHDLRRTCARLCHQAGGELEQIQFLLGHVSVQTTERYLGCKQRLRNAVNDNIGLEPEA
jgi:site-specific recombinase XerD